MSDWRRPTDLERVRLWLVDEGFLDNRGVERTKPGHGSCCTCQTCGFHHDDCRCELNEHNEQWARLVSAMSEDAGAAPLETGVTESAPESSSSSPLRSTRP